MHNSLYIRDLLKRANADPLRIDRRNPHRLVGPDPDAAAGADDMRLEGCWQVRDTTTGGLDLVVSDLSEFLRLMGIEVSSDADRSIELELISKLAPRESRLVVSPTEIQIEGGDLAGLWAGVAWLERMMRVRRGPFLPIGEHRRTARWKTQISQGPWGGNYSVPDLSPEFLGDDAFRLYAHYGVNSMMIYGDLLCYAGGKMLPELNHPDFHHHIEMLADASRRAARFGLGFSYVVVGPKLRADHPVFVNHPSALGTGRLASDRETTVHCLCSSDNEVIAFYQETFRAILEAAPDLAGFICIIGGESFYHCRMWPDPTHRCERCFGETTEAVVSNMLGAIAEAVHDAKPEAFVAAWPYNTDRWEHPDALDLIRRLPASVAYLDQIDRKQWYDKGRYRKLVWDYSIDYIGPADQHVSRAAIAHGRGLKHYIRTETGIGLEVFQFPYVPAMNRLADKWNVVRALRPDGVHQSWLFFGMFGSRAEELGLWAAYGDESPEGFLREIAVRDFGPAAADACLAAWRSMSEAVGHIPCITLCTYYIGPSFLGPCHPLMPNKDDIVPEVFDAVLFYLQEGEETFSKRRTEVRTSLVMTELPESASAVGLSWDDDSDGWEIVRTEYRSAAEHAREAWQLLRDAWSKTSTEHDRTRLAEETALTELVYRTFLTCANTVEFLQLRDGTAMGNHVSVDQGAEASRNRADPRKGRMRQIAHEERESSERALAIYRQHPWLDLSLRTDGVYSPCEKMIAVKASLIDEFLGRA